MWKLKQISATNLCAFKHLDYTLPQNHTTLIFGNNMDNDSQGSNGSGKSALIEAIAIGLTGETLRSIKMEEIINDAENEAKVSLWLYNDSSNQQLYIDRYISRKASQIIKIMMSSDAIDGSEAEDIVLSSVAEYNKYILELLGLSKDEVFANFILSKHKYHSFLSSSDREKKEIINRFSNGVIVDESIAALQIDMVPIQESLKEAESLMAKCTGQVSAIQEQINEAIIESTEKSQNKAKRIASMEESIANKRAYIREQNQIIDNCSDILDQYDALDEKLQEYESGKHSIEKAYEFICNKFVSLSIALPKDYVALANQSQQQLDELQKSSKLLQKEIEQNEKAIQNAEKAYLKLQERFQKFQSNYDAKSEKINKQINNLLDSIKQLENTNDELKAQRKQLELDIASLQKQLAGAITCPKCQYEFTLANNIDVASTRRKLQDREGEIADIGESITDNTQKIDECVAKGREMRTSQNALLEEKSEWSTKLMEAQTTCDDLTRKASTIRNQQQDYQNKINALQKSINEAKKHLFDEAFDLLDEAIKVKENALKQAQTNIANAEGVIRSFEESIVEIQQSSETDMIDSLKKNLQKYERELDLAISNKEHVEQQLATYKMQEATFIEFKTHLANTKIDALSHITNEFLQAIGSDIRIVFSGFTVLKSGKIRDKISISLVRDGVDCGSFDKFSEGEKARVNLANILAMHKLTNVTCEDDKGLDLLVLDEILEATDEQGLSNIFNALNQLQITALVVSHGNIAEGYPYKTVVNKLNGISYIND